MKKIKKEPEDIEEPEATPTSSKKKKVRKPSTLLL